MNLIVSSPPAAEPVTLDEAKQHLRIDGDTDDALITAMITAARIHAENFTRRSFVTQGWNLYFDKHSLWEKAHSRNGFWRHGKCVRLPKPPIVALTSVNCQTAVGVWTPIDTATYYLDIPGRQIIFTDCLPETDVGFSAYRASFTAGYGDASAVPETVKLAIKTFVLHFYENRSAFDVAAPMAIPAAGENLLYPYRIMDC